MSLKMKYHRLFSCLWIKTLWQRTNANIFYRSSHKMMKENDSMRWRLLRSPATNSNLWVHNFFFLLPKESHPHLTQQISLTETDSQSKWRLNSPWRQSPTILCHPPTPPWKTFTLYCLIARALASIFRRWPNWMPSEDPWPMFVVFWLLFVGSVRQEGSGVGLSRWRLSRWSAVDIFVPLSSLILFRLGRLNL